MDTIFSAPTVQLTSLLSHLTDAPASDQGEGDILQGLTQAVAIIVCVARSLVAGGTAAEEAERIVHQMKLEQAKREAARAARAADRRAKKKALAKGRKKGELAAREELEDSDSESEAEEEFEQHSLPCPSLSKLMYDFVEEGLDAGGDNAILANAVMHLETGKAGDGLTVSWGATQVCFSWASLMVNESRSVHDRSLQHS
jgi:hypothetical protein